MKWMRKTWRGLRVAFALESRHFDGRKPDECDLLVVLHHNWRQCPVPVLEMGAVLVEAEA